MNTSLISKSFTAVVVLLVALNGWSAEKEEKAKANTKTDETYEQCMRRSTRVCMANCTPTSKDTCKSDCKIDEFDCGGLATKYDKK